MKKDQTKENLENLIVNLDRSLDNLENSLKKANSRVQYLKDNFHIFYSKNKDGELISPDLALRGDALILRFNQIATAYLKNRVGSSREFQFLIQQEEHLSEERRKEIQKSSIFNVQETRRFLVPPTEIVE